MIGVFLFRKKTFYVRLWIFFLSKSNNSLIIFIGAGFRRHQQKRYNFEKEKNSYSQVWQVYVLFATAKQTSSFDRKKHE